MIIYLLQILQFGSSEGFDIRLKTTPSCCELGLYSRRACTPHRWALTPPFHLYRRSGSLLSVTLSLGSPQPSVRWNSVLLQLGLSSFAYAKAITCHTLGAIIAFSSLRIAFKALATFNAIFKIWPPCKKLAPLNFCSFCVKFYTQPKLRVTFSIIFFDCVLLKWSRFYYIAKTSRRAPTPKRLQEPRLAKSDRIRIHLLRYRRSQTPYLSSYQT